MGLIQLGQFQMRWGQNKGNDNYIKTPNHVTDNTYSPNEKEIYPTQNMSLVDIYKTTAEVYIVFNRFASMFSNGVWKLEDLKGNQIEKHEVLDLLNNPNPLYSGKDLDVYSSLYYWITGNAFLYKSYDAGQQIPTLLHLLPSENMKIVMTKNGIYEQTRIEDIIERYDLIYDGDSSKYNKQFKPKEIAHFKNNDITNMLVGESVIEALHMAISNIRGAYGYRNVNIVKRGALGVLYNESGKDSYGVQIPGSTSEKLKVEKQYTQEYGIFESQAKISIMNGKWGFASTSGSIKDMMLFEEVSEDMKKIIDAVGLNDNIFSKEKSKVQANLNEGLKMAYQDGIIPFADKYTNYLNESLGLKKLGLSLKKDYSHLEVLQENEKEKSEVAERNVKAISTLIATGKYTKEEAELIVLGAKQ